MDLISFFNSPVPANIGSGLALLLFGLLVTVMAYSSIRIATFLILFWSFLLLSRNLIDQWESGPGWLVAAFVFAACMGAVGSSTRHLAMFFASLMVSASLGWWIASLAGLSGFSAVTALITGAGAAILSLYFPRAIYLVTVFGCGVVMTFAGLFSLLSGGAWLPGEPWTGLASGLVVWEHVAIFLAILVLERMHATHRPARGSAQFDDGGLAAA